VLLLIGHQVWAICGEGELPRITVKCSRHCGKVPLLEATWKSTRRNQMRRHCGTLCSMAEVNFEVEW